MIRLDNKTKQEFLSPERMQKLIELGVDTSDSKFCIIQANIDPLNLFVVYKTNFGLESQINNPKDYSFVCDTYTLPELLLKVPEWVGKDGYKGITFFKDAPFYGFYYKAENSKENGDAPYAEYPLIAGYNTLVWCIKNGYGYVRDISDKGDTELDIDINRA